VRSIRLGALILGALLLAPRAHAICGAALPAPRRLLAGVTGIPAGAGIVVDLGTEGPLAGAPSLVPAEGGARVPLAIDEIAPGLVVLRVSSPLPPGRYTLAGVLPSDTAIRITAASTPLPAPDAALRRVTTLGVGLDRGRDTTSFDAEPVGTVPPGAVALVARWTSGGRARATWTAVSQRERVVHLAMRAPCLGRGELAPVGAEVRLSWIDAAGRSSPESGPIAVQ
jgi:hypothetical protein